MLAWLVSTFVNIHFAPVTLETSRARAGEAINIVMATSPIEAGLWLTLINLELTAGTWTHQREKEREGEGSVELDSCSLMFTGKAFPSTPSGSVNAGRREKRKQTSCRQTELLCCTVSGLTEEQLLGYYYYFISLVSPSSPLLSSCLVIMSA